MPRNRRTERVPGRRGWKGRGGGRAGYVLAPDEWRGSTNQVCGLWPFAAGAASPMIGVPLGRSLLTGSTVCCDPVSWFWRAQLTSRPGAFILGDPGLGKSTTGRRWALGLAAFGVLPFILGDLKPDYVDLIRALGGQVITIAPGRDTLNVLDARDARAAAGRLTGERRDAMLAGEAARRHAMVAALITIARRHRLTDREELILYAAMAELDDRHDGVPVLEDLLHLVQQAPDRVRQVAIDRGDMRRYQKITEELEASLMALVAGPMGELFGRQTTTRMVIDRPVVFDVSRIGDDLPQLQAATLMASWSYGFGLINIANELADAGLEPQRHYATFMDELWRVLRVGEGMVDRADAVTRLNRNVGVSQTFITHTLSDLLAVPEQDREKARGFAARAGMVLAAGLPQQEMGPLSSVVPLTDAEQEMLVSWQDPDSWDRPAGHRQGPPGLGKILIKVGGRPGIPVQVVLSERERELHNTNKRWATQPAPQGGAR